VLVSCGDIFFAVSFVLDVPPASGNFFAVSFVLDVPPASGNFFAVSFVLDVAPAPKVSNLT
jgi:hypothetical protein